MVILLDKHKKPAGFTTESHLRRLTEKHNAVIYRKFPCVAILTKQDRREFNGLKTFRIKIDPGATNTGISIVCNETNEVVLFMQIEHRGIQVKANLETRQKVRKSRRNRKTGYRRRKYKGGRNYDSSMHRKSLTPSIKSTADNIINWCKKLKRWVNLTTSSVEAVRFDTQLMDNPDINGIEYQQGELFGYELKEYLLDKYGHTCQYCNGVSGDVVLEWEHIIPRSRGGSNSAKNATLSCKSCNREKSNKTPEEWAKSIRSKSAITKLDQARLDGIYSVINKKPKASNRYCAWVNASRHYLESALFALFGEVECSSGGRTKYNRKKLNLPKDHHYDALCVGIVPDCGYIDKTNGYVLMVKAKGRGTRLRGNINSCGIITVKYSNRTKTHKGFMTGDIVYADVPKGKHKGRYVGRIAIRQSGNFRMIDTNGIGHDIGCQYMTIIQKSDGYAYHYERRTI